MSNQIQVIKPYKWNGLWVFDDPAVGLNREPFVGGANIMIDVATDEIENAENGFLLLFSSAEFPGYRFRLDWVREEFGGNVYFWDKANIEGWLCPALLRYFDKAPKRLFIEIRSLG